VSVHCDFDFVSLCASYRFLKWPFQSPIFLFTLTHQQIIHFQFVVHQVLNSFVCSVDRFKIITCHSNSTKVLDASKRYIDCSLLVVCCIIAETQEPPVDTLIRRWCYCLC
jgi:hypothetical protein